MASSRPTLFLLHGSLPLETAVRPREGFDFDILYESHLDAAALRALVKQLVGVQRTRFVTVNYDKFLEGALRSATTRLKRTRNKSKGCPRAALRSVFEQVRKAVARVLVPKTAPCSQNHEDFAPLLWVRLVRSLETEALGLLALRQRRPIRT